MGINPDAIAEGPLVRSVIDLCEMLNVDGLTRYRTSYQTELTRDLVEVAIDCPEKPKNHILEVGPIQGSQLVNKICLVSGGADSTIAWYLHGKPLGLYANLGQLYFSKEVDAIEDIGIKTIFAKAFISDPYRIEKTNWKHIIPGRNLLLLTLAAECLVNDGLLIFGVVDGEGWNSGKGDKSKKFVSIWREWYRRLTGKTIHVETLTSDTKAGWLRWFISSGYDVDIIRHKTITCFSPNPWVKQCGNCQACLRKYLSFVSNNIDIASDFGNHPMVGAKEYVEKYKIVLKEALDKQDFSHYSQRRCEEDLEAIYKVGI